MNSNITNTNNINNTNKSDNEIITKINQNNIDEILNNKEDLNILNNKLDNNKPLENKELEEIELENINNLELSDKEKYNIIKEKDDIEMEKELPTFLSLDAGKWGYISAVANFASVVFQLYTTFKTKKAKSFSILFIYLLTFLNLVYVFLGILTENTGLIVACGVFVIYNLIIVYFYYFGK